MTRSESATVVPYPDGPLVIRGDFTLQNADGTELEHHGTAVALCRCGNSKRQPLCDGTHKLARAAARRRDSAS